MVRLKEEEIIKETCFSLFQFLDGAIKSCSIIGCKVGKEQFQFLDGAIKSLF